MNLLAIMIIINLSASKIIHNVNEYLYEPPKINLMQNGAEAILYVRLCETSSMNGSYTILNMTRYCYCRASKADDPNAESCSIPGPTLLMHNNTNINVTVVNEVIGSNIVYNGTSKHWNNYKDMDVTNLHVHGIHVSPAIDDVLVKIYPAHHNDDSWSYLYDIGYHYPGTFWYHAHHHGSTTWQVNMGLHGAISMNSPGDIVSQKYEENILMFEWFYVIPSSICTPCPDGSDKYSPRFDTYLQDSIPECPALNTNPSISGRCGPLFNNLRCNKNQSDWAIYCNEANGWCGNTPQHQNAQSSDMYDWEPSSSTCTLDLKLNAQRFNGSNYAMCDVYCLFPPKQKGASQYIYDVTTDLPIPSNIYNTVDPKLLLYFVNGQLSPKINMTTNVFRRLRMINSLSNWYLQFLFPSECQWHLIATDGVYIKGAPYQNYNLSNSSHNYQYIMSPGGRVDLMVKCISSGLYEIKSTNATTQDPEMLSRIGTERVYTNATLFKLEVSDGIIPVGRNETPSKSDIPMKQTGSYIEDLTHLNSTSPELETKCYCNYNNTPANDKCEIAFSFTNGAGVNNKPFNITTPKYPHTADALTIINANKAYEFTINNNNDSFPVSHTFHQHINPFQVQTNIGKNGFIALSTTWWDTLGNNPKDENDYIRMRFWTRDYQGLIITHCHLLQHEDQGMMGFYNINGSNFAQGSCPNQQLSSDGGCCACTDPLSGPNCNEECDSIICNRDSYCCEFGWDSICAGYAKEECKLGDEPYYDYSNVINVSNWIFF